MLNAHYFNGRVIRVGRSSQPPEMCFFLLSFFWREEKMENGASPSTSNWALYYHYHVVVLWTMAERCAFVGTRLLAGKNQSFTLMRNTQRKQYSQHTHTLIRSSMAQNQPIDENVRNRGTLRRLVNRSGSSELYRRICWIENSDWRRVVRVQCMQLALIDTESRELKCLKRRWNFCNFDVTVKTSNGSRIKALDVMIMMIVCMGFSLPFSGIQRWHALAHIAQRIRRRMRALRVANISILTK